MNNQQVTKILNYFRINHDFHSPYSLIIDGNFLKILVEKDLNLEQKLKSVIPGKFKLKVTKCTIQQLGILGHEFQIILRKAKEMLQLKCQHSFQTVDRCILEHIEKEQSLIVCSQDTYLRRKLRNTNVGIMYFGPDQRITMQDIQRHQLMNMKQMEKQKFLPAENERQQLNQYKTQQEVIEKVRRKRQQERLASARGVQLKYIKKKIVKGPNPLSVKQKKLQDSKNYEKNKHLSKQNTTQIRNEQVQKKKRIRKRNKNKGSKDNNNNQ